jgi:amino acid adenylation domain-containing protein
MAEAGSTAGSSTSGSSAAEPSTSESESESDRGSRLLHERLARRADDVGSIPLAPPGPAPLTPTQAGLWFDSRVDPAAAEHHRPTVLRLTGPLDVAALDAALDALAARHPTLRTSYPMTGGRPTQVVHPAGRVTLEVVGLRAATDHDLHRDADDDDQGRRSAAVARLIAEAATHPFRVETEAPVSARLVELAADDHVLVLAAHHLAIDGPSADRLQRELGLVYEAILADAVADLDPLPFTFADWVCWSTGRISDDTRRDQLSWWHQVLSGWRPPARRSIPLPTNAGGHLVPDPYRPAVVEVSGALDDALRALARAESVTRFGVLLAGLQWLLLCEWSKDDVVIGVPVTDRGHPRAEGLVGCFVGVLPVRLRLVPGDTGRSLVARAGSTMITALAHRSVSLGEIVAESMPRDEAGQVAEPLTGEAQIRSVMSGVAGPSGLRIARVPVAMPGPGVNLVAIDDGSKLVLEVSVPLDGGGPAEAQRLGERLLSLLDELVRAPDQRLDGSMAATVSTTGDGAPVDYPAGATLTELFAVVEARHGDAVAVEDGDRLLTFGQLGDRARQLAAVMRNEGMGPGHAVGLDLDRSLEFVVAALATVMAGAAYVPFDARWPAERRQGIVADAAISLVVGPGGLRRVAPTGPPGLPIVTGPRAPVYVMYTSGSTGAPKGVMVAHRGIVHLVLGSDYLRLGPGDAIGLASTPAFDVSTAELWGALLSGARAVVIDHDTLVDPARLEACLRDRKLTSLQMPTALFNAVVRHRPAIFSGLRDVWIGGEAAEPRWMRAVLEAGAPERLVNDYGPTETTVSSLWQVVDRVAPDATSVPIGRAIGSTVLRVLDEQRRLCPSGVPGELYIGGPGVALGYLNQPELTAERFVSDPFADRPTVGGGDARLYRTGDLVVVRPDGLMEFIGRIDGQVKIRGFRIELGEIEVALMRHPAVDLAAVRAWRRDGDSVLAAYVVAAADVTESAMGEAGGLTDALRLHLRQLLPPYMVPSRLEWVGSLPLTPNAKIDRSALPEPDWDAVARRQPAGATVGDDGAEPEAGVTVGQMGELWARNLGLSTVDPDTDYFELGGHSLKAVALLADVQEQFGPALTMADLVWSPTARRLTDAARSVGRGQPSWITAPDAVIELAAGRATAPLVLLPPGGSVGFITHYRQLARALGGGRRVVTFVPQGMTGDQRPADSITSMVAWYLERVRLAVPAGPIVVGGHSLGGVLALEVARVLESEGYVVEAVVLLDTQWRTKGGRRLRFARGRARYRAQRIRRRLGLRPWSDRRRRTSRSTPWSDLLGDHRMAANLASWRYRRPGRPRPRFVGRLTEWPS